MEATLLLADKDAGEAHAATDAHACHKDLPTCPLCDAEACSDLPRARRAEWVTERDRAAIQVDLGEGEAERLDRVDGLRGKRLVDLEKVDLIGRQTGQLKRLGNRNRRTDAGRKEDSTQESAMLMQEGGG